MAARSIAASFMNVLAEFHAAKAQTEQRDLSLVGREQSGRSS